MTVDDINLFKLRIASIDKLHEVEDAIRVFRSNAEVDAFNTKALSNVTTEGALKNAYDFCVGDGLASVKEKVLSNVQKLKTTETYGLPLEIYLKVGAKYMMTVNIDIDDGLVNGACGKLIMIDYGKLQKTNETVPCRLWIKFNEEKTGRKASANFHNVMRCRNIDPSLTPVEPVTRQINTRSTNFKVEHKQFPVVPSEAMTIYKSQGGTYEKVVVNLKKGMTRSEIYVACSRATKASGLYLIGEFVPPKPPESTDAVTMMFKTMRSERKIKFLLEFPEESQEENITERYEYSGKDHIEYSSIKVDDICIISVYNSPNSSFDVLQRHMKEVINRSKEFCENIIVVGDFNINLKVKTNHKLIDYMKSFGLILINRLNKNSTNAETQIDYCFANMHNMKSDYFESLTSFHKPIWIRTHKVLAKIHFDENEDTRTNMSFDLNDDQFDTMEVDNKIAFDRHDMIDKNEQIDLDMSLQLQDLSVNESSDMMEIEENSSSENFEIVDSNSRKILDRFLFTFGFDNVIDTNQISSQARISKNLIEKAPFITMQNKDKSVRLETPSEYPVPTFDSVYARTRTTADGNC